MREALIPHTKGGTIQSRRLSLNVSCVRTRAKQRQHQESLSEASRQVKARTPQLCAFFFFLVWPDCDLCDRESDYVLMLRQNCVVFKLLALVCRQCEPSVWMDLPFICSKDRQEEGQSREEDPRQPGEGVLGCSSARGELEEKGGTVKVKTKKAENNTGNKEKKLKIKAWKENMEFLWVLSLVLLLVAQSDLLPVGGCWWWTKKQHQIVDSGKQ